MVAAEQELEGHQVFHLVTSAATSSARSWFVPWRWHVLQVWVGDSVAVYLLTLAFLYVCHFVLHFSIHMCYDGVYIAYPNCAFLTLKPGLLSRFL